MNDIRSSNKLWEWREDLSDTTEDTQDLLSITSNENDDENKSMNERSTYDTISLEADDNREPLRPLNTVF